MGGGSGEGQGRGDGAVRKEEARSFSALSHPGEGCGHQVLPIPDAVLRVHKPTASGPGAWTDLSPSLGNPSAMQNQGPTQTHWVPDWGWRRGGVGGAMAASTGPRSDSDARWEPEELAGLNSS